MFRNYIVAILAYQPHFQQFDRCRGEGRFQVVGGSEAVATDVARGEREGERGGSKGPGVKSEMTRGDGLHFHLGHASVI